MIVVENTVYFVHGSQEERALHDLRGHMGSIKSVGSQGKGSNLVRAYIVFSMGMKE